MEEIIDVPESLAHLVLAPFFSGNVKGLGPARFVWLYAWVHCRPPNLEVFPGDGTLEAQTGLSMREVQAGLLALERHEALERLRQPRGRANATGRVLRLNPAERPRSRRRLQLPSCAPLRVLCERVRDRPHADVAVMLGLFMLANELQPVGQWRGGMSPLFRAPPRVLRCMLAVGRNTPGRSIRRLAELELLELRSRDGNAADGIRVMAPGRWSSALALGHASRLAASRGRKLPHGAPAPRRPEPRGESAPAPPPDPWFDAPPPDDVVPPEELEPL
jgi:hypothetical protein